MPFGLWCVVNGASVAMTPAAYVCGVDPTEAFAGAVAEHADIATAALAMAAHAHPSIDIGAQLARLDALAARLERPTRDELRRVLFAEDGLRGNVDDYYDPDNSFLNRVLDRGVGIPISLAVVMIEVGRRAGLTITGINAPSHFIVRDDTDGALLDPFNGGAEVAGIEAPVATPLTIIDRMLNNLRTIYVTRGDITNLLWVLRLRTLLPEAPPDRAAELQRVIAKLN